MANTKKRIFYYDELRALAIIFVVLCHACILYKPFSFETLKVSLPGIIYILTHVAVPIFFMLSGALLLNRNYELGEFFKKRFSRILYPFIFWVIIAIVVTLFALHNPTESAFKIFLGEDRWTWFVWIMIGLYLFLPVINAFIKEYQMKGAKYFLVIWFITIILTTFNQYPFYQLELSYFARYIGYFVLGYYLANTTIGVSDGKMILLGIVMFIASMAADIFFFMNDVPNIETKYLSLFVVIASIGIFIIFKRFAHLCDSNPDSGLGKFHSKVENGVLGKIILSLSVCSYGMYLINNLLYNVLKKFVDTSSLKMLPILFIAVLILSWAIVYVLSKIPVLDKFSGAA